MYLTLFPVSKRASCRERTLLGIWRYISGGRVSLGTAEMPHKERKGSEKRGHPRSPP